MKKRFSIKTLSVILLLIVAFSLSSCELIGIPGVTSSVDETANTTAPIDTEESQIIDTSESDNTGTTVKPIDSDTNAPEPTEPTEKPSEPSTNEPEPTEPTEKPSEPNTKEPEPTEPTEKSSEPSTKEPEPTDPTEKPSEPSTNEPEPTEKPSEPNTNEPEPTEPTEKPSEPNTKEPEPTEPTEKPSEPSTKEPEPTEPTEKPSEPSTNEPEPTEPTEKPSEPDTKEPEPTEQPTEKPTEPNTKEPEPTEPTEKPTEPNTKEPEPTESTTKPTEPEPEPHVHDFGEWKVTTAATCTKTGEKRRDCKGCDHYETASIPKTEHSYTKTVTAPTCTKQGYTTYKCTCGDSYTADYVDVVPHSLEEEIVPASCEVPGVRSVHCKNCSYIKVEPLPATGHDFGAWTVKTPATSESTGLKIRTCNNCSKSETETIPKLSAPTSDFDVLPGNTVFGYKALSSYQNAESLKALYRDMEALCRQFHDNGGDVTADAKSAYVIGAVDFGKYNLSIEEVKMVKQVFDLDHPRYFWLSGAYYYSEVSLNLCVFEEYAKASTRNSINAEVQSLLDEFKTATSNMVTRYEKALYVHDAIISRMDYKYEADGKTPSEEVSAHNIVGMVKKLGGVCESYSKSYQMILSYIGMDCINIIGTSDGAGHAWNAVMLDDGKWYNVDLTWDDNGKDGVLYFYFGTAHSEFSKKHTPYGSNINSESFMFEYETPQDEINLTPMTVYKDGNKVGDCGTFAEAFALMTQSQSEYTVKLYLNTTNNYILTQDIPNVKSVVFTGDIVFIDSSHFYRTTLYLSGNIEVHSNLCIDSIAIAPLNGNSHIICDKKLTLSGSQVSIADGVSISADELVSELTVTAIGGGISVGKLTLPDNTQLILSGGYSKVDSLTLGTRSFLILQENQAVIGIGEVNLNCGADGFAAIMLFGDLGHSLSIGDIKGEATQFQLRISVDDLSKYPEVRIGDPELPLLYMLSTSADITSYDGTVFYFSGNNIRNVYYFINDKQVQNVFEIVNGECVVKK